MKNENEIISYNEKYKIPLPENKVNGVDYDILYEKLKHKEQFDKLEKLAYAQMKKKEEYYEKIDINYVFEKLKGIRKANDKWGLSIGNVIFTDDQRWKIVSGAYSEQKGRFGLKIVETELMINQFQVIDWYTENFGIKYDPSLNVGEEFLGSDYISNKEANKKSFSPPFRNDEKWEDVFRYLNENRNIPATLLNELFDQGKLYADINSRCIFLSNASAEIRATPASGDPDFKGCSTGGQADVSGFSIMPQLNANESIVGVTEAAIDAISYNVLYPGRYVFSSNGSGRFDLQYKVVLEALSNRFSVAMATDADIAGDVAAQKIFSALLVRNDIYIKYKKENKNLTFKDIDKAIIEKSIVIRVDESPHHLFFNELSKPEPLKKEYPVYERTLNENTRVMSWVDTGKMSEKEFAYKILPGAFDFITESIEYSEKISNEDINNIIKKYHIFRDRPFNEKDWNAELKILGSVFSNKFNEHFENGFKDLQELPEYFLPRKETMPIIIDENGNAIITKDKTKNKEKLNNKNNGNVIEEEKVFKLLMNRQQIFNTIYIRYYFAQNLKMPLEVVDEKIKNGEIKFSAPKGQPYLNFINNKFSDKIEYISKNKEEGDPVYYPPTIKVVYGKDFSENKNIVVSEIAFNEIIKRIDHFAKEINSSENQFEALNRLNIHCFNHNKEGFPIFGLMGKGELLEKTKKINQKPKTFTP